MAEIGGRQAAALAHLASMIERAAGDLSIAEEPSRFIAALEGEDDGGAAEVREAAP